MSAVVPLAEQIAAVAREISQRQRVYPRLIERGTMSQKFADKQITAMEAVLETLKGLSSGAQGRLI